MSTSNRSHVAALTAEPLPPHQLSIQQLEELLRQKQQKEQNIIDQESSHVEYVTTELAMMSREVGPQTYLAVLVEGVPTKAIVNLYAQSTVISRQFLHAVGRHLHSLNISLT